METRPFFVIGDLLVNLLVGGVSGLLASSVVDPSWNPIAAMFVGMLLGMLTAMPLSAIFMPLFGAFEIMIPGAFTGMVAGMLVAMAATMRPLVGTTAIALGASCGLSCLAIIYLMTFLASKQGELGP